MLKLLLIALFVVAAIAVAVRMMEPQLAFFPLRGEQETPATIALPFEPSTIQTRDGERLRAWFMPGASPRARILYFHGNGGNLSVWLPILAGIVREGYAVAAVDYRGYGLSTGSPSERGLYLDVESALDWMAALPHGDEPLVFWGRSLGATMAAYAATRVPPDGLILEAGFPDVGALLRGSPVMALVSWFSSYRFPTTRYLREAGCPMLVMHGDADRVVPFASGRALFDAAPEPKRFEAIRGGDHNDASAPDPDRYWRVVGDFVDGLRISQGCRPRERQIR